MAKKPCIRINKFLVSILVAQWLNCCTTAKIVLMTRGSIPGSQLKVDSAFYPSEVSKMSTQLAGGGGQCVACIINL